MTFHAFKGEVSLKEIALSDAREARHAGWSCVATDEERAACSERFGLDLSLINLLSHAFNVPYREASKEKLRRALSLVELGVDTRSLVRGWAINLWNQPRDGISYKLDGTPAYSSASEIIRLVETSGSVQVPRDAWRRARAELTRAVRSTPQVAPYADVVSAMAWDFGTTPRVTTDIWDAWAFLPKRLSDDAEGWTKEKEDQVLEEVRRVTVLVNQELGPTPKDPEGVLAYNQRRQQSVDAGLVASGYAASFADWLRHAESLGPRMRDWYEAAEARLFEACSAR